MRKKTSDDSENVVELRPKKKAVPRSKKLKANAPKRKTQHKALGLTRQGNPRKATTGRKPKITETEETLKQIEGLGRLQATIKEMAAFFSVSEPTMHSFLKSSLKAREAIDNGAGTGNLSLRRHMWKKATEGRGSVAMMIWLSKQQLGMTDKLEENVTAKHEHTFVDDAATDFDGRLASLLARATTGSDSKLTH